MLTVRDACVADARAIRDLYNALIPTTTVAWTETLETLQQRQAWLRRQQRGDYPVLVAEADGVVVGFASYGSFRGEGRWPGYRYTVEHSIHVEQPRWGTGIGSALMLALIERARSAGIHVMVGAIDSDNTASLQFHERLGFSPVALMPQVGRKFERWLDLVLVQRLIEQPS
jgi:L-amino acid N-acyltransferase